MIRQPEKPETLEDVHKSLLDLYDNLSFEDIKIQNPRTDQPADSELNSGRIAFAEVSGVPILYYKTQNGTLYKFTGVLA